MKFRIARWACLLLAGCLTGCQSRPSGPVWDVPALVGRPIEGVKAKIGAPQSEATADAALTQSVWQRDDTTLSATWKTGNKRVTAWTLSSRDEAHAVREEERASLLVPGKLQENDARYSIEWIEAPERPLFYTGVRVVPAPQQHAVVLRLSGSPSLVQISYSITGAGGKTETSLTIAPWEETFTLADDAQISLSADFYKTINGGKTDMKIEIFVDGKVVESSASSGAPLRCKTEL